MTTEFEDLVFTKVVILGDTAVGKTSLLQAYVLGEFKEGVAPTIGASFLASTVNLSEHSVKLQMWDTAGQERFKSMVPMYYRGAEAAILVFDIVEKSSFKSVKDWVAQLREHGDVGDDIVLSLVANKIDIVDGDPSNLQIIQEATAYAKSIGATLSLCSAKTSAGLEPLFVGLASSIVEVKKAKNELGNGSLPIHSGRSKSRIELATVDTKSEGCKC